MSSESLLSVKNLTITYRDIKNSHNAVRNLSLEIQESEIVSIIGESGSGKSSIALAILALVDKADVSGEIKFRSNTINILQAKEKELQKIRGKEISIIFQEPIMSFSPVYTCGKQLIDAVKLHQNLSKKESGELILDILNQCGLEEADKVIKSYPHELSGGQLQRVAIALAIINKPKLLIADELVSNLDYETSKKVLSLLKKLQKELNLSILFISHDLKNLFEFSDRIYVMHNGSLVENGTTNQILKSAKNEYTKRLVESSLLKRNQEKIQNDEKILEIKGLKVEYRKNKGFIFNNSRNFLAVSDIDFHLKRGEILGLVGKSGSGKTSIGKSIVRLIDNSEGEIIFDGVNINNLKGTELRNLRKNIQIIFQEPEASLNPKLSIKYSLKEPILNSKLGSEGEDLNNHIEDLLKKVDLNQKHLNRKPSELSGGEKQRVCIARALSLNPKILICDESVSALDANIKKSILDLLMSLRKELGLSIIFISHDLDVINYICDRKIQIEEGKIISENLISHS